MKKIKSDFKSNVVFEEFTFYVPCKETFSTFTFKFQNAKVYGRHAEERQDDEKELPTISCFLNCILLHWKPCICFSVSVCH